MTLIVWLTSLWSAYNYYGILEVDSDLQNRKVDVGGAGVM